MKTSIKDIRAIGAGGRARQSTPLGVFCQQLARSLEKDGMAVGAEKASKFISMEGLNEAVENELDSSLEHLGISIESLIRDIPEYQPIVAKDGKTIEMFSPTQHMAGQLAGIYAENPRDFWSRQISTEGMKDYKDGFGDQVHVMGLGSHIADAVDKRLSMEAYDERENRNAITYSIAYNMQAARQDDFGETFFPTVVVTPDQTGFMMSIRQVFVYNEVRRATSGAASMNWNKKNIIQAVIDPTILANDQTDIVPVVGDDSTANFVASSLFTPTPRMLSDGEEITTAPLLIGKKFDLLGLSQTDLLLQTGILDSTDAIDPSIQLKAIYMKIGTGGGELIRFQTLGLPLATFNAAPQGVDRLMQLNFSTLSLLVNSTTKKADGSTSTTLAPVGSNSVSVRLGVDLFGNVNCQLGDTVVNTGAVTVVSVYDEDGNSLPLGSGTGATIAALFAGASVVGYDLDARRTNSNRRERGQLLDITYYNQLYTVPLRSPITVPRPLTSGDQNDASDLAALITTTRIRTSNSAVKALLDAANTLVNFTTARDPLQTNPDVLGVGATLVQPFYEASEIEVDVEINSLTSAARIADVRGTIINTLRDTAYRMYRDSGYKAAADALAGGMAKPPTLIIGTDPVIANYLMTEGDLRTFGIVFDARVVWTLNEEMRGKIVMSFGDFSSGKEGVPNPLHFGNMAWKPELTLVLPLHRNGANSKELTVVPSYLHVVNLPVMAVFTVTGLTDAAVDKTTIAFDDVTPTPTPSPSPSPSPTPTPTPGP